MKCYLSFCDAVVFCNSARVESRRWRKMAKQRCSVVRERRFHLTRPPAAAAAAAASAANGQILIVTSFNAIMSDQSSLSLNSPRPSTFYAFLSASPYASPYTPPSLCRPISAAISTSLSLCHPLYLFLCVPLCPHSASLCLPPYLYTPLYLSLSVSHYILLSASFSAPLLPLSLSATLSNPSLCLTLSPSILPSLPPSLSTILPPLFRPI